MIMLRKEFANSGGDGCAFMSKHMCGYNCASSTKVTGATYSQKEGTIRTCMLPKRDPAERMARVSQGYQQYHLQMTDSAFGTQQMQSAYN